MWKFSSPQGVVPALPQSSLLWPATEPRWLQHRRHCSPATSCRESSVCTSAARDYFKNRPSMIRKSEKHLEVQDCRKNPHYSKETLTGSRAFCMIHGQHGTWNISVVPFPRRAVLGLQEKMPKYSQNFCTASWIDAAKCIWRKKKSESCAELLCQIWPKTWHFPLSGCLVLRGEET